MTDKEAMSSRFRQRVVNKHGRHQRVHYTTVNMVPCRICGGKSTGYHFGVVSCEACKAFFRRAIAKESQRKHTCQNGRDCANQSGKISSCYDCRLRRCKEVGMSTTGVRRGRYSIELRTKSILDASRYEIQRQNQSCERNQTNSKQDTPCKPPCNVNTDCVSGTSTSLSRQFPWIEKSTFLKSFVNSDNGIGLTNQNDCLMKALFEGCLFCNNADCISENVEESLGIVGDSLDLEPRSGLSSGVHQKLKKSSRPYQDEVIQHAIKHEGKEGPLVNLDKQEEDEHTLDQLIDTLVQLQSSLYPQYKVTEDILHKQKIIEKEHQQREEAFMFMFGTTEYTSSHDFKEVLSEVNIELDDRLIRFGEKARATESSIVSYIYHSKFIPGFKQLDKDDVSKLLKASYFEFWIFSNFATMNEKTGIAGGTNVVLNGHKKVINILQVISTFLPKDHVDSVFGFCLSLQKLDLSLEEVSIIRAIVLTISDRCTLKEPHRVDSLNQNFIRCLQYHLKKSTANPSSRFYKIIDRLIAVRSLVHKNKRTNVQFLKDWGFLMAEFPLWKEMMVSQLSAEQRDEATQ